MREQYDYEDPKTHLSKDGQPKCNTKKWFPLMTDKKQEVTCGNCIQRWRTSETKRKQNLELIKRGLERQGKINAGEDQQTSEDNIRAIHERAGIDGGIFFNYQP